MLARPRARRGGARLPRRAARGRCAPTTQERFMSGEVRGDRRDQRVRDGDRQGRRADRLPRHGAGLARGLLPGGRPRRARRRARPAACCSPSSATRACTCSSSSASRLDAGVFERVGRTAAVGGARRALRRRRRRAGRRAVGSGGGSAGETRPGGHRASRARGAGGARAGAAGPGRGPGGRRVGPRARSPRASGSARDAERARWAQYRSVWEYVEGPRCRRAALLAHFGDRSRAAPSVACCDVCSPAAGAGGPAGRPRVPGVTGRAAGGDLRRRRSSTSSSGRAAPPVGRTRAVEILRGGRSKVIVAVRATTGLAAYGAFAHLRSGEVLGRVDQLLEAGTLRSTGGRFPKLRAA